MNTRNLAARIAAIAVCVLPAGRLAATVVLPTGLSPGDQYQLIFVTNGVTTSISGSIATYNTLATNEAALGVPFGLPSGLTWRPVVSTADGTVANVNAPSGPYPVYSTSGVQVAAAGTGIYAGSLLAPLLANQYGLNLAVGDVAYTGSTPSGASAGAAALGGLSNPQFGRLGQTNSTWISESNIINGFGSHHIYVLSEPITFGGAAIPEAGGWLFGSLACALCGVASLRHKRRSPIAA